MCFIFYSILVFLHYISKVTPTHTISCTLFELTFPGFLIPQGTVLCFSQMESPLNGCTQYDEEGRGRIWMKAKDSVQATAHHQKQRRENFSNGGNNQTNAQNSDDQKVQSLGVGRTCPELRIQRYVMGEWLEEADGKWVVQY